MAVQHSSGSVLWTRSFVHVNYRARVKQREIRPDKKLDRACVCVWERKKLWPHSCCCGSASSRCSWPASGYGMTSSWSSRSLAGTVTLHCYPSRRGPAEKYYRSKPTGRTNSFLVPTHTPLPPSLPTISPNTRGLFLGHTIIKLCDLGDYRGLASWWVCYDILKGRNNTAFQLWWRSTSKVEPFIESLGQCNIWLIVPKLLCIWKSKWNPGNVLIDRYYRHHTEGGCHTEHLRQHSEENLTQSKQKYEQRASYQFGVDFSIQPSITNEVNDPSFCLFRSHIQLVCQHAAQKQRPLCATYQLICYYVSSVHANTYVNVNKRNIQDLIWCARWSGGGGVCQNWAFGIVL